MKNFYYLNEFTIENAEKSYDKLADYVAKEYNKNDRNPHWVPGILIESAENRMTEALDYINGKY